MSVQRKTITVTPQQDSSIKSQLESGSYGNDSKHIRDLIRKDYEYKTKLETLRSALIAGENSGVIERNMNEILADAKKRHSLNV
jgi:antitoxin ParD1/3/4